MTEKLFKRSVIYKLLAASKNVIDFSRKKKKSMIHYPKKKDYSLPEILLLEFVYKWLSNFVLFLPSQPPHPPDRACMTCIRPKRKMSVLLLWSQFIIMIKIHETFNQNQLFCLKFLQHHRSKLSLTCGLTSSGCKNLFDKQDNLSLRQW